MFTWVNHNSLYILIFIFPVLISLLSYFYITKNKIIVFSIFFFLIVFFLLIKILLSPQESTSLEQSNIENIFESEGKLVVEFFSPNCLGCILSENAVKEFNTNYSDEFNFIKLNISDERYSSLVNDYQISVTPTFLLINEGKVINKYQGVLSNSKKLYEAFNHFE
jgi:thiol-disulfide isomerase/thioredoxin